MTRFSWGLHACHVDCWTGPFILVCHFSLCMHLSQELNGVGDMSYSIIFVLYSKTASFLWGFFVFLGIFQILFCISFVYRSFTLARYDPYFISLYWCCNICKFVFISFLMCTAVQLWNLSILCCNDWLIDWLIDWLVISVVRGELGQWRQGYMGHLTRIANQLLNSSSGDIIGKSPAASNALVLGQLTGSLTAVLSVGFKSFF